MPEVSELRALGGRVRPISLAADRVLPLAPGMAGVVGGAGLGRGSTLTVAGPGATSLALAVLAGPVAAGSWLAIVGSGDLGLVAGFELGLALERVVVVDEPEPRRWSQVVATLAEAFEVVLVRTGGRVRAGEARRIEARARQRGGVLCLVGPDPSGGHRGSGSPWPSTPDLTMTVTDAHWVGVTPEAPGAGHLRARRVSVALAGRRHAGPGRAELWLPDDDGRCHPVEAGDPMGSLGSVEASGHRWRPSAAS